MSFLQSIKNKTVFTIFSLLTASAITAQTTAAAQPATSENNGLAVLFVIMIVLLAFVIWGLGHVLTALGRQVLEKNRKPSNIPALIMFLGFSLLSQLVFAQDAAVKAVENLPNYGGLSATTYYFFLSVLVMEVVVILFLVFLIRRMYTELLPEKPMQAKESTRFADWWSSLDKKLFTRAVPVEQEEDVLLDHDYDGIKELDNALPPWWKYGFYITIGVAFIYLLNFHVFGIGLNPAQEYNAEMERARIKKEIYEASNKDRIDENNVPMAAADGIQAGKNLFQANCVACHLADGGGSVGPNLTDNYWLHKGSLNDIYNTIKNGYPDKGMQSWSGNFTPKEISYLASYIKTLVGTKPAVPKPAQGDFYVDVVAVADSLSVTQPDTVMAAKPDTAAAVKK